MIARTLILKNELIWLKSIGCTINLEDMYISVKRNNFKTTDFNFIIPRTDIIKKSKSSLIYFDTIHTDCQNKCIRLSSIQKNFLHFEEYFLSNNFKYEENFDINFISIPQKRKKQYLFKLKETDYNDWKTENEQRNIFNGCNYYFIIYKSNIIGKVNLVIKNSFIGIYDFEIFNNYRNSGLGTQFLEEFISNHNKIMFIQTWSDNTAAIKCYLKAGFHIYENLYKLISECKNKQSSLVHLPPKY
jgi:predicted acetyltransferase